jgi:hypothetical protein
MVERDDRLERAIDVLREPVSLRSDLERRIMAEVQASPPPRAWARPLWSALEWMRRGRPITVSPLGGLALAAGLAAILLVGRWWPGPEARGASAAAEDGTSVVQFVIHAPAARSVSLVGDFNDWSQRATPMQEARGGGVWTVTLPLDPGRYRYAFLLDGSTWLSDPSAPRALDDEFGPPSSVVTIGGS